MKPKFEIFFEPEKHRYYYNETRLPGVTDICEMVDKGIVFRNWLIYHGKEWIEEKQKRGLTVGDAVHRAVQGLINGTEVEIEINPEYEPAFNQSLSAFRLWWQTQNPKPVATELVVASVRYGYAGRLDFIGKINNKLILYDWKTASGFFPEYQLQVVAYEYGLSEMYGVKINKIVLVRFDKETGEFETKEMADKSARKECFQSFLGAKTIYEWQMGLKEKKSKKLTTTGKANP